MGLTEPFDVLDWLNCHRHDRQELTRETLEEVLSFVLMWNLFEKTVCERNANINTMSGAVARLYSRGRLTLEEFQPYLVYFQNRYLTDGKPNDKFLGLELRSNDQRPLVEDVLRGKLTDITNIVLALLIVVYRLRNNLFHGTKNVFLLPQQDENFAVANRLLAALLDCFLE